MSKKWQPPLPNYSYLAMQMPYLDVAIEEMVLVMMIVQVMIQRFVSL